MSVPNGLRKKRKNTAAATLGIVGDEGTLPVDWYFVKVMLNGIVNTCILKECLSTKNCILTGWAKHSIKHEKLLT